jgi:secreted trypsin-like serine protease
MTRPFALLVALLLPCATAPALARTPPGQTPLSQPQHVRVDADGHVWLEDLPRVVNGCPVAAGQAPWHVSLTAPSSTQPGKRLLCGGSHLGDGWVLTAAHCVAGARHDASLIRVATGGVVLSERRFGFASGVAVHEDFHAGTMRDDIALVKAALPAGVPTLRLVVPAGGDDVANFRDEVLRVYGFGARHVDGSNVDLLQVGAVRFVNHASCNGFQRYDGDVVEEEMFCAQGDPGSGIECPGYQAALVADACHMDSGGPLVAGVGAQARVVGLVSWGTGCGNPLKPGVYTRLGNYLDWIATHATGVAVPGPSSPP